MKETNFGYNYLYRYQFFIILQKFYERMRNIGYYYTVILFYERNLMDGRLPGSGIPRNV